MSILRVANLQFNASGTKRIDYDATNDDGIIKISADAIKLPIGDTASRPNSQAGMIRYNSDLGLFEGANSTAWGSIGGVVDFATANGWANAVGVSANSYTNATGIAGNNYTDYVGASANSYATTMDTAGNNYTNAVGLAGNNYVNAVVFPAANSKFANATGTFAGALTTTGTITANSYLYITPSDGIQEGGEIQLSGAGNYTGWAIDSYMNAYRVFARTGVTQANLHFFHAAGGTIKMGVNKTDPLYTLDVAGTINASSRGITTSSVPANSVIQVAWNGMSGTYSGSGASLRDTGLGASFTPLYSTSRILHIVTTGAVFICDGQLCIARNGTVVSPSLQDSYRDGITGSYSVDLPVYAFSWIDSPATTSTITYRLWAAATGCGQTIFVGNTDGTGSWLMMEIAG